MKAQHQSLDSGFVGLIISCFNGDQVLKCTAFQTSVVNERAASDLGRMSIDQGEDEEMKEAIRMSLSGCLKVLKTQQLDVFTR